jgi:hypothetical protein
MIPAHRQARSISQHVRHILGFFQPNNIKRPSRLKIISLVVFCSLSITGWISYTVITTPVWEIRDIVLRNKWLSLGASILLDPNIIRRAASAYTADLDIFDMDIKFKRFRQLEITRHRAIKNYSVLTNANPYVKARVTYGGKSVPIKLKLKGQSTGQHLGCRDCSPDSDGKVSYRVKVTRGETVLGMRRFALMSPARRGSLNEWVFRQALSKEGIISKRYALVKLIINGSDKGVYFIDEHYDKNLLEYAHRPDSVVVRFHNPIDESKDLVARPSDDKLFSLSYVETYEWFRAPPYNAYLDRAIQLLDEFSNGKYSVPEVFDADLFARYFALADVFGAWHGLSWLNLRFYFNPITGLLEPIPDDNFDELNWHIPPDRLIRLEDSYNNGRFLKRFMADKQFVANYLEELDRVSHPEYLEEFWNMLSRDLNTRINVLRKDKPLYDFRYRGEQGGVIGILQNQGIGIDEINYRTSLIRSMLFDEPSNYQLATGIQVSDLYDSNKADSPTKWCTAQLKKMGEIPEFVQVDPVTSQIHIDEGSHTLAETLVIPKDCPLIVSVGVQLSLENGAFIVSSSPIYFRGTTDNPIHISSTDKKGGGILVMNSPKRSEIVHTYFSGLSNGINEFRFLNGAVTFYRSDVTIDSTVFDSNISGDDYLNIIASQYSIKNTVFQNTISDGFDSDYSDGHIENVTLNNIGRDHQLGGDGLDFSGSNALIKNTHFSQISDKAISVGERSKVKIEDIVVQNATNAIVSKDGSVVEVEDASLKNIDRALVVIKKKSGYEPATLTAKRISFDNVNTPYLLEQGSTLQIDGVNVKPNTNQGKAIVYQ